MSNEREGLARELFIGDNGNQPREASIADWEYFHAEGNFQGRVEHYEVMADAILAAGYRKPRVIETAEELDALPNGSIVVDSEPDVLAKKGGKWQSPNYADDRFDSRHLDFPVTVISEGATS